MSVYYDADERGVGLVLQYCIVFLFVFLSGWLTQHKIWRCVAIESNEFFYR